MAHILIIEDDDATRKLWAEVLTEAGHQVKQAVSGVAGCESVEKHAPDLVITDILMPEMDGIETLLTLRSQAANAMKIIVVSGGGMRGDTRFLQIAERLGADMTMQKPIELDRLETAVSELVGPGNASLHHV